MWLRSVYTYVAVLFFVFSGCSFADDFSYRDAPDIQVTYNNQKIAWGTSPVYVGDSLYVPLRDVMPALDISIFTNRRTFQTTLHRHRDDFKMVIEEGSPFVTINGERTKISESTRIIKNRVYVPLVPFLEKLGYGISGNKGSVVVATRVKPVVRKGKSFFLEAAAPFDFKVSRDKKSEKIIIRLYGVMLTQPFKGGRDNATGVLGVELQPVTDKQGEAFLSVEIAPDTKYSLYQYEGKNVLELELTGSGGATASEPVVREKEAAEKPLPPDALTAVAKTTEKPKLLKSTGRHDKPSFNSIWLPSLKNRTSIDFAISGQDLLLKAPYVYKEGSLMVPLKRFYELAGYNVHVNSGKGEATVIRDDGVDFLIRAEETGIVDRSRGEESIIRLDVTPEVIGNDMYVPLVSFTRVLGMGIRWDDQLQKVFINHRIYEVAYEEYAGMKQITIRCTGEISLDKVIESDNPSIIFVSIPNTNLDIPEPIVKIDDDKIDTFRIVQLTNNVCRLAIDTKGKIPYGIISNDNILEGTVRFSAGLTNIAVRAGQNLTQLILNSSSAMNPSIQKFSDPQRLVIDIPDTVLRLPEVHNGDGKLIKRVRASQFQWNPLITRIVVDLEQDAFYSIEKDNNGKSLEVFFSLEKIQEKVKEKVEEKLKELPRQEKQVPSVINGKLIVVEAGHGGIDPGAIGRKGTAEKHITLTTAQLIKEELSRKGARVIMCRESDVFMSLNDRVLLANKNQADIYVSVHYNSFTNASVSGTETFYYKSSDYRLAEFVHRELVNEIKRTDKGLKKANLYVLHHTTMPAVLIEPIFISNKWDELLIRNENFQRKIAAGVTKGVERYCEYVNRRK